MLKLGNIIRFNRIFHFAQVTTTTRSVKALHKKRGIVKHMGCNQLQLISQLHLGATLHKYNKQSKQDDEDDSDDENVKEFTDERDSKVLKANVNSLRADLLLKAGLGMARNKVETIFYESKIRVNGKKLNKKSVQLNVGDEIDVIRGFSHANPNHLVVSRVIILDCTDRDEGYSVQLRRYKSLLIENYSGTNVYKSSETVQH